MTFGHIDLAEVRDRAYAGFLGLAVGDALGAPLEFMTSTEIRAVHGLHQEMRGGGWLRLRTGGVTDDTEMSLCIARAIDAAGWSVREIADRFATWLRGRPTDVGNTCRRGIQRYIHEGTPSARPNEGDAGNGAAMRMVPVAIASLADSVLMERWAIEQAHITHHHPLSDASCALVGRLLHLACIGLSREHLRSEAQRAAVRFPALRFHPYRSLSTAYVADTMQTVLHYFFATSSFEECLVSTVNQGGDADTTGAIVGAIAGAFYGAGKIPKRWVKKLDPELVQEISTLAGRLIDHCPLSQGATPVLSQLPGPESPPR